jgi:hypothetical protein
MATQDLLKDYMAKAEPLKKQSDTLLKDYGALSALGPTFLQKLSDAIKQAGMYPSSSDTRATLMGNKNLRPEVIESLTARETQRGMGSIQDVMNRANTGFEADITSRGNAYSQNQSQLEQLTNDYNLARQAGLDEEASKQYAEGLAFQREQFEYQKQQDSISNARAGGTGASQDNQDFLETANKIIERYSDPTTGQVSWSQKEYGDAFQTMKTLFPDRSDTDIDNVLGNPSGYFGMNTSTPEAPASTNQPSITNQFGSALSDLSYAPWNWLSGKVGDLGQKMGVQNNPATKMINYYSGKPFSDLLKDYGLK